MLSEHGAIDRSDAREQDFAELSGPVIWRGEHIQIRNREGWEYVERTQAQGVVAIVALTEQRELVLTEQFRKPVGKNVVDLAAGLVGDTAQFKDEDYKTACARELEEETGFRANKLTYLFERPSSAGLTNEMVSYFLAEHVTKVANGGGVGSEKITVHVVPRDKVDTWLEAKVKEGLLIDGNIDLALRVCERFKK